jgi:hypothetical protein
MTPRPTSRARTTAAWREAPPTAFPIPPLPLGPPESTKATRPWPVNESDIDLPTDPPPPLIPPGILDPLYLGPVTVTQRGIGGPFTLDVLLAHDGAYLDLGPFRVDRNNLQRLHQLFLLVHALLGHDRRSLKGEAPDHEN